MHSNLLNAHYIACSIKSMKQQASLLSFFAKGKKKRQANDGSGGSSSSSPSWLQPAHKKQTKEEGFNDVITSDDADADASFGSGASSCNVNDDETPLTCLATDVDTSSSPITITATDLNDHAHEPSSTEDGAPQAQDHQHQHTKAATITTDGPATTPTIDSDGNDQDETTNASKSKAIVPPSPATDTTDNSSDSEDDDANESGDEESDDYTSTTTNKHPEGKSAYELLREQNIARNNARLLALGLVTRDNTHSSSNLNGPNRNNKQHTVVKRKKASGASSKTSTLDTTLPKRRSSRLRKPVVTENGTVLEVVHHDDTHPSTTSKASNACNENVVEAEEFTVSPLIEYQMGTATDEAKTGKNDESTLSTKSNDCTDPAVQTESNDKVKTITTLIPSGPRLNPPSGLNAIYSLHFHPSTWGADNAATIQSTTGNCNNATNCNSWLVGAGKSGLIALWDCSRKPDDVDVDDREEGGGGYYIEPVISWKGHGGRWIADARFVPPPPSSLGTALGNGRVPSRLLTAGNNGTVCYWDLTSTSTKTGVPKLLQESGKSLHSSGIFSMDFKSSCGASDSGGYIVTGSKDKTLAVSTIDTLTNGPLWRSNFHRAKVGCVSFSSSISNTLIASASDDGMVGIHDARLNGMTNGDRGSNGVVAKLEDAHAKPHSAVWMPDSDSAFMTGEYQFIIMIYAWQGILAIDRTNTTTLCILSPYLIIPISYPKAGLDEVIKLWDLRNTSSPIASYHGHVPCTGKRLKRIHRPTFLKPFSSKEESAFILSGGEGSHAISMFQVQNRASTINNSSTDTKEGGEGVLFSRGKLPIDVGDIGSLAVHGRNNNVAVAVEGGEVLLLTPN